MSNKESVFNVKLSYSEIDTLLMGLYNIAKTDNDEELKRIYAINTKLRDSRHWENIVEEV